MARIKYLDLPYWSVANMLRVRNSEWQIVQTGIPSDAEILTIREVPGQEGMARFVLESQTFEDVPPGHQVPSLEVSWGVERVVHADIVQEMIDGWGVGKE